MVRQLRTLEKVRFVTMDDEAFELVLDCLCAIDPTGFQSNLKILEMAGCCIGNRELEFLVLDIISKFSKLSELNLEGNDIRSSQQLVGKIMKQTENRCRKKQIIIGRRKSEKRSWLYTGARSLDDRRVKLDNNRFISKSIRRLILTGNPIMDNIKTEPKEKTSIISLLKNFDTIYNIGGPSSDSYDSNIAYELRINHAGRSIVEGSASGGISGGRSLPLSVWPALLERAANRSNDIYHCSQGEKSPDGLHYLICNGPAVIDRSAYESRGSTLKRKIADII
jgi:hypothetical protein